MSDVQVLFAVLAGLYLWECACWLRRDAVAVATWLGTRWQLLQPGTLVGNQRGGFVLAPPLPPLGSFLAANQLPFTLAPEGVLFFVATNVNPGWRAAHSGRYFRFDEVQEVRADRKKLFVNGRVLMRTTSPGYARHLAEILHTLKHTPAKQRTEAIQSILRASLDTRAVEQRWNEATQCGKPIRRLANVLFILLFIAAPALIWRLGFGLSWPWLLAGLLALTISIAVCFRRGHRRLFPKLDDERFTFTLTVALAPTSALRAHDLLTRHACETFHPLAVAKVFLPPADFEKFAGWVLRDLRHPAQPVCPDNSQEILAVEAQGRGALLETVEIFLRRTNLNLAQLLCAPESMEGCQAYCPRCETQFTSTNSQCADCGGLAVVAFAHDKKPLGGSPKSDPGVQSN